jgi:predicted RNA-binding protein YlxR (DUF448 family)
MSKSKHIPERTCCVCRKKRPKTVLLAVIRLKDGTVVTDSGKISHGRSAYLCPDKMCLGKVAKAKGHDPLSFSLKVKVPQEIFEEIDKSLSK